MSSAHELLEACESLGSAHLVAAVARFGSPALGVVHLPSLSTSGSVEASQVGVAAVLFCAAEL